MKVLSDLAGVWKTGRTAPVMTSAMSAATAAAVGPAPAPGPWMKMRPIRLPSMNRAFRAPCGLRQRMVQRRQGGMHPAPKPPPERQRPWPPA